MSEAKVRIDADLCTGCGVCVSSCPADVLRMDADARKAVVAYPSDCQVCYLCEDDCPEHAIALDHDISNSRRYSIYDLMGVKV